jgi:hypothetical protein
MEKPKRGAPEKPPDERKSAIAMIRLTESERAACEAAAELDGLKMAAWARKTLTSAAKRRIAKA